MQFTARQRWLEHIASVHRALAFAGADHGVQLINKQYDPPFLLAQLIEHRLQALLELAAKLGTRDQRAHIQRKQALILQAIRYLAIDDALGQAFGNRSFTDARLADQHRVILGAALQYLNGAANLVVTTDYRVELAFFGTLGQVDGVFIQSLAIFLDVRVIYRIAAAQVGHGIFQRLAANALTEQQLAQLGVLIHRGQQHQLAGDKLVALLLRQAISLIEQTRQVLRQIDVAGRVLDFAQLIQLLTQSQAQAVDIKTDLHQQRLDRAALLFEQCLHQVQRLNGRMVQTHSQGLRIGERELQLAG